MQIRKAEGENMSQRGSHPFLLFSGSLFLQALSYMFDLKINTV